MPVTSGFAQYKGGYLQQEKVPVEPDREWIAKRASVSANSGIVSPKDQEVPETRHFAKFDVHKHLDIKSEGQTNPSILIYGARGTGKTHILKHLLTEFQKKKHFDKGYLFSNTAALQPKVYDFLPPENIHKGFRQDIIERIWAEQEKDAMTKKKNNQEKKIKRIVMIFDDIISTKEIANSPVLDKLYTEGRHIWICPIILSQVVGTLNGPKSLIRTNADLVIAFYAGNQYDRDLMTERYLSIRHKKIGEQVFRKLTEDKYNSIVIVNKHQSYSKDYPDYVYQLRAPEKIPSFMIGNKLEAEETSKLTAYGYGSQVPAFTIDVDTDFTMGDELVLAGGATAGRYF